MTEFLICGECGRETKRNAANQKYCPGCAILRRHRLNEESKERRRNEAILRGIKGDEETELLNTLTTKGKRLARIVAEARAFGMTYGTYTAAIRDGSIERILRAKGFTDPEAVLRGLTIK